MTLPPLVAPGPALTGAQVSRYSRHLLMPTIGEGGQRRLLAASIAVIGAGGLGSPSLLYLAGAGVGRITVVDDDVVDETNLQRQVIHSTADVGRPKIDSALERVRALNPDVTITGVSEHLDADNASTILAGHDLVLDGSDNFETRYAVADACDELGIPLVWAAVYRTEAHLTVFWTAAPDGHPTPGLRDLFPTPPAPGSVPACGDAGVVGPLVGQVGSMMATEAIKLITGVGVALLGRLLFIDVLAATQREIPLVARGPRAVRPAVPRATALPVAETSTSSTAMLSPAALAARLTGADTPFVIDVREDHEVATGTVPGAVHIPVAVLTSDPAASAGLPSDRDIVLVCRAGPRAHLAATALRARGLERLFVLEGGMLAWPDPIPLTVETR
ncbi:molybdopterin biosynthesis protein MoeB [Janibacter sp. Soil728]|uniref:ThiF family adenylyltransferase n=1 Tax=Janibacter sp. Soil728 TaxID=1736393 RepID=UPI0007008366|nr:ThiF family adenylyltransferase [Janibacter sp. Soil728]KRE37796.1 molybdopterin biosynthesis protein MoeB [Janibacter sp. Soil728]